MGRVDCGYVEGGDRAVGVPPHLSLSLQSGFLWLHPVITALPTRWTLDLVFVAAALVLALALPASAYPPESPLGPLASKPPATASRWYRFISRFEPVSPLRFDREGLE